MNAQQFNGTPAGYAVMIGGLLANLVAVIATAAAGFVWVGKIDARVESTREIIIEMKQREMALQTRLGSVEQLAAGSAEKFRAIEKKLDDLVNELRLARRSIWTPAQGSEKP